MRTLSTITLVLAVALLASCGSSSTGACVQTTGFTSGLDICMEDFSQAACEALSPEMFYPGQTCADVGYTQHCSSAESPRCFCEPGYPYCP